MLPLVVWFRLIIHLVVHLVIPLVIPLVRLCLLQYLCLLILPLANIFHRIIVKSLFFFYLGCYCCMERIFFIIARVIIVVIVLSTHFCICIFMFKFQNNSIMSIINFSSLESSPYSSYIRQVFQ